ncbi:hypothetical protein MXB_5600 [Myxobolus squamalis]|nr:hypothetical protein MXB_5600 [Myxobolus squamalis]
MTLANISVGYQKIIIRDKKTGQAAFFANNFCGFPKMPICSSFPGLEKDYVGQFTVPPILKGVSTLLTIKYLFYV